jgi:hypothetical protein
MLEPNPFRPPSAETIQSEAARSVRNHTVLQFASPRALAAGAIVGLSASAAIDILQCFAASIRISVLQEIQRGVVEQARIAASDRFYGATEVLELLAVVATGIVFLMWFYRVYRNLRAFGVRTRHGPGWAPGGFFVPIVNLYLPYQIAKELSAFSSIPGKRPRFEQAIPLWWVFYLAANILSFQGWHSSEDTSSLLSSSYRTVFANTLNVVAALAAILMVREVTRCQQERAEQGLPAPASASTELL